MLHAGNILSSFFNHRLAVTKHPRLSQTNLLNDNTNNFTVVMIFSHYMTIIGEDIILSDCQKCGTGSREWT